MWDFNSATRTIQALASNSDAQHEEYEEEKQRFSKRIQ